MSEERSLSVDVEDIGNYFLLTVDFDGSWRKAVFYRFAEIDEVKRVIHDAIQNILYGSSTGEQYAKYMVSGAMDIVLGPDGDFEPIVSQMVTYLAKKMDPTFDNSDTMYRIVKLMESAGFDLIYLRIGRETGGHIRIRVLDKIVNDTIVEVVPYDKDGIIASIYGSYKSSEEIIGDISYTTVLRGHEKAVKVLESELKRRMREV